jgi:hypothetical protein
VSYSFFFSLVLVVNRRVTDLCVVPLAPKIQSTTAWGYSVLFIVVSSVAFGMAPY